MGVYSGPGVVNSGLVFNHDMSNTQKSWKGMPTTNLIYDTTNFSNSLSEWQAQENVTVTKNQIAPDGVTRNECIKITCNSATDSYFGVRSSALTDGNAIHTFSCWLKANKNTTIPIKFGSNQYTVNLNVTSEWQYFSASCTANLSLSNYLHIGGWSSIPDNTLIFFVYQPMYEKNTFATPFVSGSTSRSNTQTLLDVTGQNTVTANSLTYNSDGTFTFAGASNYASITNSALMRPASELTIEYLIKGPTPASWTPIIGYGNGDYSNGNYLAWVESGGALNALCRINNSGVTEYRQYSGQGVSNSVYKHMTFTMKIGSTMRSYYNGIDTNSAVSLPAGGSFYYGGTSSPYQIGGFGGAWMNATVPFLRFYNRVLTADEVFQNFSAIRSLYGL